MPASADFKFISAVPVWERGRAEEMNVSLIFRGKLSRTDSAYIHIAASSKYQIFVNGEFFASGPARAPHGFYRVDVFELAPKLTSDENTVAIIVAGYNSNSFYLLDEPSFLCAEITADGEVKYATGSKEFEAERFGGRLQRVMRYSFQRPFTECYVLDAWYDGFVNGTDDPYRPIELEKCGGKKFITRTVPYAEHTEEKAQSILSKGILIPLKSDKVRKYDDRSFSDVGENLKGFAPENLETNQIDELYAYTPTVTESEKTPAGSFELGTNCFALCDMGENTTGYIRLSVTAQHDAVLYAVFGERLNENGMPEPASDGCANVVQWSVQGGRSYDLVSFEPYTFKYISVVSVYAPTLVTNVSLYAEKFPEALITNRPSSPDKNCRKFTQLPSIRSVSVRPISLWTARRVNARGGSATAFLRLVRSVFSRAKRLSRTLFSKTFFFPIPLRICPTECCRCVIPPTIPTAILYRTGRCGSPSSLTTAAAAAAIRSPCRRQKQRFMLLRNISNALKTPTDFSRTSTAGYLSSGQRRTAL